MACRHAYKMLDRAEDLTCEDCLFEIKAQEYERGLKDAHQAQQKPTVTEKEIESAIYAGRNWDDGKFYDKDGIKAVMELFKSKGFKIDVVSHEYYVNYGRE